MQRIIYSLLMASCLLTEAFAQSGGTGRLNDTGLTTCRIKGVWTSACVDSGQDAEHGRDVAHPNSTDGRAGFSWQKVDSSGNDLPPSAPSWTCVRDKVTGLMWEVKTDDGGPRDKDNVYMRSDGAVAAFPAQVNEAGLCGRFDWRLPTRAELLGVIDLSKLPGEGIDTAWFPNAPSTATWTSSCATCNYYEWTFVPNAPVATGNYFVLGYYEDKFAIRLVSDGGQMPDFNNRYSTASDEATDKITGLTWKRCSAGTEYSDATGRCDGTPLRLSWVQAIHYASAESKSSGKAWRVPNLKELDSLLDLTREARSDYKTFPGLAAVPFWSSTAYSEQAAKAWCVQFGNGDLALTGEFAEGCKSKGRLLLVRDK